ncbi:hypothetical protein ACFPRL_33120 [Pseudoclavibacter helvolus]
MRIPSLAPIDRPAERVVPTIQVSKTTCRAGLGPPYQDILRLPGHEGEEGDGDADRDRGSDEAEREQLARHHGALVHIPISVLCPSSSVGYCSAVEPSSLSEHLCSLSN